jgi:hypothetical protein
MSNIAKALAKLRTANGGEASVLITHLQSKYMKHELKFWANLFESEVAYDPEDAAAEEPPRAEAAAACRTLLRFFK